MNLNNLSLLKIINKNQNTFKRCCLVNLTKQNYELLLLLWKNTYILGFTILTPTKILIFLKNVKLYYIQNLNNFIFQITLKKLTTIFYLKPNLFLLCKTKQFDFKFLKNYNKFYI